VKAGNGLVAQETCDGQKKKQVFRGFFNRWVGAGSEPNSFDGGGGRHPQQLRAKLCSGAPQVFARTTNIGDTPQKNKRGGEGVGGGSSVSFYPRCAGTSYAHWGGRGAGRFMNFWGGVDQKGAKKAGVFGPGGGGLGRSLCVPGAGGFADHS